MKNKRLSSNFYIFTVLFVVLFILTTFLLFFNTNRRVERILYFPDESGIELYGEMRRLPVKKDKEEDIRLFVKEQLLGPATLDLYRLFPKEVKLDNFLMDKNTLYINFSENLVTMAEQVPMSLSDIIISIKKSIVFNFPKVKEIQISIGGEPLEQ